MNSADVELGSWAVCGRTPGVSVLVVVDVAGSVVDGVVVLGLDVEEVTLAEATGT